MLLLLDPQHLSVFLVIFVVRFNAVLFEERSQEVSDIFRAGRMKKSLKLFPALFIFFGHRNEAP